MNFWGARRLRRAAPVVLAATLAVAAYGLWPAGSSVQQAHAADGLSNAQIGSEARWLGGLNGDGNPTDIQAVRTTRGAANQAMVPGTTMDDPNHDVENQDVYAIAMDGNFIGYKAAVPPGAPLPIGTTLTMVIDAATGELLDWGIHVGRPNLASAGSVMNVN